MRVPEASPYMPLSKGMPMTSVLGREEREKSVMDHSSEPLELVLDQMARTTKTITF